MRALIIDDERNSRELLSTLLERYCDEIAEIRLASDVEIAIHTINEFNPNIVFLDIEMPRQSGFDLLDVIEEVNFLTCFVTGYEQYAIRAIKYGAFGYLLKPVNLDELKELVSKADESQRSLEAERSSLLIRSNNRIDIIKYENIVYLRADGNYTEFFLRTNERIVSSKKIGEYDSVLPNNEFFRTHKSYIVNLNSIIKLSSSRTGDLELNNGDNIPVSSRKLSLLKGLL